MTGARRLRPRARVPRASLSDGWFYRQPKGTDSRSVPFFFLAVGVRRAIMPPSVRGEVAPAACTARRLGMKVRVDAELCVACGACVDICPEVFDLPGETAVVKMKPIPAEHEEAVREAAEACPTEAILLEE